MKIQYCFFFAALCVTTLCTAQPVSKRNLQPSDLNRLQNISDPRVSPDGKWVAYTLSTVDSIRDKRVSNIWMVSTDGTQTIQLTRSSEGENTPRWSPDGKYISFISSRMGEKYAQVWLLDRRGGEARKLTDIKGDLESYAWSPDGNKLVMVIKDQDFSDTAKSKTRNPFVMDRYHFKEDIEGYIENRYSHLYLYNLLSNHTDTLTRGNYDDSDPSWSPDGKKLAFVSNRSADPDRNDNTDIWVMDAKSGAFCKRITSWKGGDHSPKWSPDGIHLAYLQTSSDEAFTMYGQNMVALTDSTGSFNTVLTKSLDRPANNIHWMRDGHSLLFIVSDDRSERIDKIDIANQKIKTLLSGYRSFLSIAEDPQSDSLVALMSTPQIPAEIYAIHDKEIRRLTYIQDNFINPIQVSVIEGFNSTSKDGTVVSGILYLPPGETGNHKLPLILFIHGGPVAQDNYSFDLTRQILAAAGYAVAAVNYRGSNGRGLAYTRSIMSDWGNKEVADIIGAADFLVEKGIADPERIGIGGWSYGGILTDYCIASDTRFKAAASGAGSALQLSMYGVDQYVIQYEHELGTPWTNMDKWIQLSYPFFHADRIKTPTLFMAGEKDFNVPSAGAEQMYQALKSLGIPAKLVIYPGQFHGITKPSYQKDRLERYLQWFGKYLQPSIQ